MDANFGIGFYFFDRFFGTIAKRHRRFNWCGYKAAIERYGWTKRSFFLTKLQASPSFKNGPPVG